MIYSFSFSRLKEFRDTAKVVIFTLDIPAQHYPILTFVENLPHDSMYLLPCPTSLGGVVVITSNAIIYVDQSSRRIVLPVNGWTSRISDIPTLSTDATRTLVLEGSRSIFVDEKTFFLILKDGTVHPVDLSVDGKTVSKLTMSPPLAQTSIPSIVRNIGNDHIFIGSTVGPSVLLKAARVQEEVGGDGFDEVRTAVVREDDTMEYDDEDEGLQTSWMFTVTDILKTYTVFHRNQGSALIPMDSRALKQWRRKLGPSFICP